MSPERALAVLRCIQTHRMVLPDGKPVTGVANIDAEQLAILQVEKPATAVEFVNLQWNVFKSSPYKSTD